MTLPAALAARLTLPVIGAPMFLVSTPDLVIAQCRAGIVGAFPALNARPVEVLDEWLARIVASLGQDAAPFAVNLIVNRTNARLAQDLDACVRHRVPIVITSLGARPEVNEAVHEYGGLVLHDVINLTHARKALEKGADGLIAVAAGAGGHAGTLSPFALVQEIRAFWDGPLALSGAIATGGAILAAQAMGADLAYVGSAFIATQEADAAAEYQRMVVEGTAADIVNSNLFTGVYGNYLKRSVARAGLDPDALPAPDPARTGYVSGAARPWRDIWSAGHGIGAVGGVCGAAELVARLGAEYAAARARLGLSR